MSNYVPVEVSVDAPPRGGGSQDPSTFVAQSMRASFAWGTAPGTATLVYVGSATEPRSGTGVQTGAWCALRIGAHLFYGICKRDVENKGSGEGLTRTLEFVDLREFLGWDYVFGAFNKAEVVLVNGQRIKRYKHLLPGNYDGWVWTWTAAPLMGWQILSYVFNAPTLGSAWAYNLTGNGQFPGGVMNFPIHDLDCLGGKRLDALLAEVCERTGTVVGLGSTGAQPYRLVFTRKGYGAVPVPPANSDDRRIGWSLSGNPSNVRILGERNLYQVQDVPLVPDWNRNWEPFLVFERFAEDIYYRCGYDQTPEDPEGYVGRQLANARALSITVGEYAALAGSEYEDRRKFANRSRMDMPAATYLSTLLFRAFRPNFRTLTTAQWTGSGWGPGRVVPLESLDLADRLLCKCYQSDPTAGTIGFDVTQPGDGNGFAIAKGYMVGADLFKAIRSDQFDLNFFRNAANVWQSIPFQIDDSGEGVRFLIFEEPVVVSDDLITEWDGHRVINADFTLRVPEVKAALVFEAERFSRWNGVQGRDQVENVSGLNLECVVHAGGYTELVYANGMTCIQKADQIANGLLQRQYFYVDGGHKLVWDPATPVSGFGTALSSMVDRVQITTSPTEGTYEVVDYTTERGRDSFEPERELDRKTAAHSLLPGQAELRVSAETARKLAAAFRQLPSLGRLLRDLLGGAIGSDEPLAVTWFKPGVAGNVPVGTPVRKAGTALSVGGRNTNTVARSPLVTTDEDLVFLGVTVRNAEDASRPFKVQASGVALCQVQGPVEVNDVVGLRAGSAATGDWDFLVKGGVVPVGRVLQTIGDDQVWLVQVKLGAGGGGGAAGPYKLREVRDDYLVCRSWDGTAVGDADIYVAKQRKHRCSLTTEKVFGVTHSYSYAPYVIEDGEGASIDPANVVRTDTYENESAVEQTEQQIIVPPWVVMETVDPNASSTASTPGAGFVASTGDLIDADEAATGVTAVEAGQSYAVTLMHARESRQWAGPVDNQEV